MSKKHSGPKTKTSKSPRRLAAPKRVLWRPKTWRRKPVIQYPKLPKARLILVEAYRNLMPMRYVMLGITSIYGIGVLLFVRALSAVVDIQSLRSAVNDITTNAFESKIVELGVLFNSSSSSASSSGTLFQIILFIICSLALIWALRTSIAKHKVTTKASFYDGMQQLIPFSLVLLIVSLQMLPLIISSYLYSTLIYNGIAVTGSEQFIAFLLISMIALWSLRMLTGGVFALYISTLPAMTPIMALRSARELVHGRRLLIWRKFIYIIFVILFGTTLLVLPFLFAWPSASVWVFYVASIFWLPLAHAYLYSLYRDMLKK